MTYTDFASWSSAVPAYETVSIPDLPNVYPPVPKGPVSTMFTTENVHFSIQAFGFIVIDPSSLLTPGLGSGTTFTQITFPHPVTAFSMEIEAVDGYHVDVLFSNNASVTLNGLGTPNPADKKFLGITDTAAFDTVLIQSDETFLYLGNFAYAPPPAVPEPGSLTLAGLGIVGLCCGRLRRRKFLRS